MYLCPMHPEIHQEKPGSCSICGMDLETTEQQNQKEYAGYINRLFWCGTSLLLLLVTPALFPHSAFGLELLFATIGLLKGGWIFFQKGWLQPKPRQLNMFSLISLGVFAAYSYSALSPLLLVKTETHHDLYFETALMITLLMIVGQLLEKRTRAKTKSAIELLLTQAPHTAHKLEGTIERDVPTSTIQVGDILIVKPGEAVPTDGLVLNGTSFVDESMFSGEPFPVAKKPESTLIGGTINQSGSFTMRATAVGSKTVLMQMVRLVMDAQRTKAPIQKIADLFSAYFVPFVLIIGLATFIFWGFFSENPSLAFALQTSISVLIIACPCALGLATPLSLVVGIGKGANQGIFFKTGEAIENAAKTSSIVLDKTGTLTEGHPKLVSITPKFPYQKDDLLCFASSLEKRSTHPIAQAILTESLQKNLVTQPVEHFYSYPGLGVQGVVERREVLLGNEEFLEQHGIALEKETTSFPCPETILYMAIDRQFVGSITIQDPIKQGSKGAVEELKKLGLSVSLVSGDSQAATQHVAQTLGIKSFLFSASPQDKSDFIQSLQANNQFVTMVGDGTNDAPSLAQANVGIAIGQGTDIAIESGSIVLSKNDPLEIPKTIHLSQEIVRNIKQNLFFAFCYNLLSIPLAAGVFYSTFHVVLIPEVASIAMILSSLSVTLNALRMMKKN